MFNNRDLVTHVKMALSNKWGYVFGTFGNVLTGSDLADKLKQYPDNIQPYWDFIRNNWLGKRTADCVGLIKSYLWWNGSNAVYTENNDVSADLMFNIATEKGDISTIPDIEGLCVHKNGHIGVYIGNGQVIESHGTKYGVIQTPLTGEGSTPWQHWLKCPYINYMEVKPLTKDEAKIIVKEKTGFADSTIQYMADDYRFGDELIIKLATILKEGENKNG